MDIEKNTVHSNKKRSRIAANIALVGTTTFLIMLIVLHILEPEFDPSWRMISEYELGVFGWMMQLAFVGLSVGCIAITVSIWSDVVKFSGRLGGILMMIVGIVYTGAAIFITDPITSPPDSMTVAGGLHNLFALIVIPGFPLAVTFITIGLYRQTR